MTARHALLTCPLDCPDACRLKITIERQPDGSEKAVKLTGIGATAGAKAAIEAAGGALA